MLRLAASAPNAETADVQQLHDALTGPRTTAPATATVDAESGLTPPPWWRGDEEASRSSMTALMSS